MSLKIEFEAFKTLFNLLLRRSEHVNRKIHVLKIS